MDKTYHELQDGPVRDLLRLALHHGVRACKPDIPDSQNPATEIDALRTEILQLKAEARFVSSLSFSLLSEIHASRRKIVWEVTGAKSHELCDHSLWSPEDAETLHRIVDHRSWQRSMLPKIAKPTGDVGKGRGKAGKQRGKVVVATTVPLRPAHRMGGMAPIRVCSRGCCTRLESTFGEKAYLK